MARRLVLVAALLVLSVVGETFAVQPDDVNVGSNPADPGEFPYQISLRIDGNHVCGGSLIGNQYVLTSARCIEDTQLYVSDVTVVTGTISILEGGEHHKIKDVVMHPNYIRKSMQNDIAIITLAAPITPNANQRPIRVASYDPPKDALLISTGWPKMAATFFDVPLISTLQKKSVNILSNPCCQLYFPTLPIFDTDLCTSTKESPGVADHGGPLVYNGEVVGICSVYCSQCHNMPFMYTRVSNYLDFINSTVKGQEFSIRSG